MVGDTHRPLYLLEREPVPIVQEAGGLQGQSASAENLVLAGI